jgi:hypothetical protein
LRAWFLQSFDRKVKSGHLKASLSSTPQLPQELQNGSFCPQSVVKTSTIHKLFDLAEGLVTMACVNTELFFLQKETES